MTDAGVVEYPGGVITPGIRCRTMCVAYGCNAARACGAENIFAAL